jgi:amino acid transporter
VLYITMSLVLTGLVRYDTLNSAAPVAAAFTAIGLPWVTLIVSAAAAADIASVMLAFMLGCARIWFAMSRDGLLPAWFAQVHPRFRTPHRPGQGRSDFIWGMSEEFGPCPLSSSYAQIPIHARFLQPRR